MEARWRCGIMRMTDKFSGEDSYGQARWWKCGTTGMNTAAEEMQDGNRRDVGQWRWRNGLNGDGLGKYLKGTTTKLMAYRRSDNLGIGRRRTCTAIWDAFGDFVFHIVM